MLLSKKNNQKKKGTRAKALTNSGIIAIVVVWVLVALTLFAFALSRRARVDLALTNYSIGKVRSRWQAYGGVMYALDQIRKSSAANATALTCTMYQCGFTLEDDQTAESLFKGVTIGEGHVDVRHMVVGSDGRKQFYYGLRDEGGRLNLNSLNLENYGIFTQLLILNGCNESLAEQIAKAALDWITPSSGEMTGAVDPRGKKFQPFDSVEELRHLGGMTPEIFETLREDITVFPVGESFSINVDVASENVLRAVARFYANKYPSPKLAAADAMVAKLIEYRQGPDGVPASEDDRVIDKAKIVMAPDEESIWFTLQGWRSPGPKYFRIQAHAVDDLSHVETDITAVVSKSDLKIVSWRRE